eukprot:2882498-Rhodomonas_salina.1
MGAIKNADTVLTVSPGYAREVTRLPAPAPQTTARRLALTRLSSAGCELFGEGRGDGDAAGAAGYHRHPERRGGHGGPVEPRAGAPGGVRRVVAAPEGEGEADDAVRAGVRAGRVDPALHLHGAPGRAEGRRRDVRGHRPRVPAGPPLPVCHHGLRHRAARDRRRRPRGALPARLPRGPLLQGRREVQDVCRRRLCYDALPLRAVRAGPDGGHALRDAADRGADGRARGHRQGHEDRAGDGARDRRRRDRGGGRGHAGAEHAPRVRPVQEHWQPAPASGRRDGRVQGLLLGQLGAPVHRPLHPDRRPHLVGARKSARSNSPRQCLRQPSAGRAVLVAEVAQAKSAVWGHTAHPALRPLEPEQPVSLTRSRVAGSGLRLVEISLRRSESWFVTVSESR